MDYIGLSRNKSQYIYRVQKLAEKWRFRGNNEFLVQFRRYNFLFILVFFGSKGLEHYSIFYSVMQKIYLSSKANNKNFSELKRAKQKYLLHA